MAYSVLITTSGTGSRLGEVTQKLNKCLIPIHDKPAIDYIFRSYPPDTRFVITLGYLGDQVKQELTKDYPHLSFTFVPVDKFEGPGSSLGYSMFQAAPSLQEPFIFHCCDTIIPARDQIPPLQINWAAGYKMKDSSHYRTLNIQANQVLSINDKGAPNFDYIHIGLIGVHDYSHFWHTLQGLYDEAPDDQTLNDTFVINRMLTEGARFAFVPVSGWYDTGNPDALELTRRELSR